MNKGLRIALGVIGVLIFAGALCALFILYLLPQVIRPAIQYKQADALFSSGYYEKALAGFEALGDYRDSKARVEECENGILDAAYDEADALFKAGQFGAAMDAFAALHGHRDSEQRIEGCRTAILDRAYDAAAALLNAERYEEAIAAFTALNGHRDSEQRIEECRLAPRYKAALALFESGEYLAAMDAFAALGDFRSSAKMADACCEPYFKPAREALEINNAPLALSYLRMLDGAPLSPAQELQRQDLYADCGRTMESLEDYAGAFALYQQTGLDRFREDMQRCNDTYRAEPHLVKNSRIACVEGVYWQYQQGKIVFTVRYNVGVDAKCKFVTYSGSGHKDKNVGTASKDKTEFVFSIPFSDVTRVKELNRFRLEFDQWVSWREYSIVIDKDILLNADKDLFGEPME